MAYLLLVGLFFAPLERLFTAHPGRKAFRMDLAFGTLGAIIVAFIVPWIAGFALARLWQCSVADLHRIAMHLGWPGDAAMIVVGLVLFELVGYLYHRAAHSNAILWRLHRVHHSAEEMDWLTSFRQHPVEILLMTILQNAPLVLLGLPLFDHALVLLLVKVSAVFVHCNIQVPIGPWAQVLAMPRFHHTHHKFGDQSMQVSNYSAMFPWLDRLFGTHSSEQSQSFGLAESTPKSFLRAMLLAKD